MSYQAVPKTTLSQWLPPNYKDSLIHILIMSLHFMQTDQLPNLIHSKLRKKSSLLVIPSNGSPITWRFQKVLFGQSSDTKLSSCLWFFSKNIMLTPDIFPSVYPVTIILKEKPECIFLSPWSRNAFRIDFNLYAVLSCENLISVCRHD